MAPDELLAFLRSELRAAVREEVDAAIARRCPLRPPVRSAVQTPPAVDPLPPLDADALAKVARRAAPGGRAYVIVGDVLSAMGIPRERHRHLYVALAAALTRLGWEHGGRLRPDGTRGPRVVAWYEPRVTG